MGVGLEIGGPFGEIIPKHPDHATSDEIFMTQEIQCGTELVGEIKDAQWDLSSDSSIVLADA